MALKIIEAKIQTVWFSRMEMVTLKRGPHKDKSVQRERRFKATVGTYLEFNDGCIINGPNGRRHQGRGTVARFNRKHGTWSVQRPQRCGTNKVGYVFTPKGEPCWLKDERESGFTHRAFEKSFSAQFVRLCLIGHGNLEKPLAQRAP
jgi:hypothetical protein